MKFFVFTALIFTAFILSGAEDKCEAHHLSFVSVIPFAIMLLSIAVLPLVKEHWWENNRNKLIVALGLGIPMGIYLMFVGCTEKMLDIMIFEYLPFIILLGSLFVISGGVLVEGNITATPKNNVIFLLIGGVLASIVGTTGAAMLLIRPFLNANKERKYTRHSVIFFIFVVCNAGGLLTPLGDPPLFLGYLKGVHFTWTMGLWPIWIFAMIWLLVIYYIWDSRFYKKESARSVIRDRRHYEPIVIKGKRNFIWLAGVVLSVAFINSNTLSFIPNIQNPFYPASYLSFLREFVMIGMVLLSLITTPKGLRKSNNFSMAPIKEVAYLFIGIFLTMVPALLILEENSAIILQYVKSPSHYFWATGALSSFLDNAPTYVTFFTAAGIDPRNFTPSMEVMLTAVSVGAVFMGANTYIGNGPNFMVKSIAEEHKVKMPSFFGYMKYSLSVLIPMFFIISQLFL